MRLQLPASRSSSTSRSRSPLPFFHRQKPPPPHSRSSPPSTPPSSTSFPSSTPGPDGDLEAPSLPYRTTSISSASIHQSRPAQDGDRPQLDFDDRDKDATSILRLVREDYVSARIYMREMDYKVALRKALRRHMYKWYAIAIIAGTLTALITAKHESVVEFCAPVTRDIRSWPVGWMIPLALLVVLSFPPLVGHEIIGILCGLVWGLGVGFAILAAGTFLGEIATWVAFKWFCQGRAAKFEKKNKLYWALTQLIREKSFMFALVLRFSAVPGHITTAVSASAGANFWQYLAAAFLTLPKQFTIVYLGKAFGTESRTNTIVSVTTTVATLIGTVLAAVYIYYQMRLVMRRQTVCVPVIIESGVTMSIAEIDYEKRGGACAGESGLHSRRPWLHTNASTISTSGIRTPTRSWSMPEHMNEEEWREWVEAIEEEHAAASTAAESSTPAIKIDNAGVFDSLPPVFSPPLTPTPKYPFGTPSRLATPIFADRDLLVPPDSVDETASSATSVIDLSYPPTPLPSAKRGESSKQAPRSGREIADEADAYAVSHGARRPNYGRMRGESRAALLGRPVDDAALEMGGGSWKRDYSYGRSRGDSGATLGGRPTFDELDFGPSGPGVGVAPNGWKRDYGRSRGESGAALLGRPMEEDLGLGSGSLRSSGRSVSGRSESNDGSPRGSLSRSTEMEVLKESGQ